MPAGARHAAADDDIEPPAEDRLLRFRLYTCQLPCRRQRAASGASTFDYYLHAAAIIFSP